MTCSLLLKSYFAYFFFLLLFHLFHLDSCAQFRRQNENTVICISAVVRAVQHVCRFVNYDIFFSLTARHIAVLNSSMKIRCNELRRERGKNIVIWCRHNVTMTRSFDNWLRPASIRCKRDLHVVCARAPSRRNNAKWSEKEMVFYRTFATQWAQSGWRRATGDGNSRSDCKRCI